MDEIKWIFRGSTIGLGLELAENKDDGDDFNKAVLILLNASTIEHQKLVLLSHINPCFKIEVPSQELDKLATVWCKVRDINANKYTVDELLGQCFDSCVEEVNHSVLDKDDVQNKLIYDNIFEVIASDSIIAEAMRENSDEYIYVREEARALTRKAPYLTAIKSQQDYISALALLEILLEDYENNLLLIDALSSSIKRFEDI